ncbi:TetR/AcrR family transcriptional regulator C-terminal domain-containing protein [Nocardia transvalensis]|nr:TetR/AcrR family transcriptional regulator C-terminal domain-containing protein [Nocardia transvalensis]
MPPALMRMWRLTGPARQGRPPALDIDRVVTAAVELADREGLSAVTLEKVAQALGFTKMALYRHIGSKDELLELMADQALGFPPNIRPASGDWRAGLSAGASALREIYTRREWLLQIPASGPPRGPHAIAWLDMLLRPLRDTPVGSGTKLGLLVLLDGYVRQSCLLERQLRTGRGSRDQATVEYEYGVTVARLIDADRYPEAAKAFATNPFLPASEPGRDVASEDFRFGLDVVLDGIAAAITRADPRSHPSGGIPGGVNNSSSGVGPV